MTILRVATILFLAHTSSIYVQAQSKPATILPADSPKVQNIRRFLKLTNTAELSFADIKNNAEMQRRANPQIPDLFWKELLKKLKPEELIERIIPVYEKHYSNEDLTAWVAFFESKSGQAFLNRQKVVLQESSVVGQAYVEEVAAPLLGRRKKK